ncbi:MAG: hypothetical protein NTW29_17380 [Bacteroidetes bacterium]|nr:hypothetical protein [Bacteroidota bacterium]
MKKTIGIVAGMLLSILQLSVCAQETTPANDSTKWDPKKNPTVDSIISPYQGKMLPQRAPLTTADIFPVIGQYESTANADAPKVSIMLDEENKGLVWIEGLPQGKIKAMLRKSPATYKIPAQKTAEGKEVAEGTLIYDKETRTLSICIGKSFDATNPAAVFATPAEEPAVPVAVKKTKVKKPVQFKPWIYVGTKQLAETASN